MPTIAINFIPCAAAPINGYRVTWRVKGSSDPYSLAGFFSDSPVVFNDDSNPEGTCYEGFLQADCSESGESGSTLVGNAIPWSTECVPESGMGILIGARVSASLVDHCSTMSGIFFTTTGTIEPGLILYTDEAMTTPLLGYDFVSDPLSGIVYNMNSGSGLIGSDTGLAC